MADRAPPLLGGNSQAEGDEVEDEGKNEDELGGHGRRIQIQR